MTTFPTAIRGVVRGKTIELESELGLPDGQAVSIVVSPTQTPGEGVRRSAGAWADASDETDAWLEQMRRCRLESGRGSAE